MLDIYCWSTLTFDVGQLLLVHLTSDVGQLLLVHPNV